MASKKPAAAASKPSSSGTPPPLQSQLTAATEMLVELLANMPKYIQSANKELTFFQEWLTNFPAQRDMWRIFAQHLGIDMISYPVNLPQPLMHNLTDDEETTDDDEETTDDDDDDDDDDDNAWLAAMAEKVVQMHARMAQIESIFGDNRRCFIEICQVEDQWEWMFAHHVGIDVATYPAYPPVPAELEFTDDEEMTDDEIESFDQLAPQLAKLSAMSSQATHLSRVALRYYFARRHVEVERLRLLFKHLRIDMAYYVPPPDELEFTDDEVTDNDDVDETTDDDDDASADGYDSEDY